MLSQPMIKWPKGIDPSEGAPGAKSVSPSGEDARSLGNLSHKHGIRHSLVLEQLGIGQAHVIYRTVDSVKTEIVNHFKDYNKRPSCKTSPKWKNHNRWLVSKGSSLRQLCAELGLSGGHTLEKRSVESITIEAKKFYAETGERPTQYTSNLWRGRHQWLQRKGYSLNQICNELGMLGGRNTGRSLQTIQAEIRKFFKKFRRCPTQRDSGAWKGHNSWLRTQGSSLSALGIDMQLKAAPAVRTLKSVKAEIKQYFNTHRKRPSQLISAHWHRLDAWLRARGSSLRKICDDLHLTGGSNWERSVASIKAEAKDYFKRNGKRPTKGIHSWMLHDCWLRNHHDTTLSKLCDQLKLP